ncbi:MAG: hypothetical protein KatS3mg110_0036 [Pirellulaceae bacterium]|nr:MAG: hypothetical protein KatS3mg110_0036 [Pirellulaceae bacterium]
MNATKELRGYLVVLPYSENRLLTADGLTWDVDTYQGAGRVPAYHVESQGSPYPEEREAIDAYVFGDFKDYETNLIPTYEKAVELLQMFSRSPRRYEIIFCCSDETDAKNVSLPGAQLERLGYDVACLDGYWSIVLDMPYSDWALPFRKLLNSNGLFDRKEDALEYRRQYIERREHDWEFGFDIIFVARVVQDLAGCCP